MKIRFISLLIVAAGLLMPQLANSQDIKVMSYNIRMGIAKDGTNSWDFRYPATAYMLQDQQPDVFGVQEAFDFQIKFITENLRNYETVGVGRDDGKSKGEHMNIFWNKKTTSMLKWGTFWLSKTPNVPSMGWDAVVKELQHGP